MTRKELILVSARTSAVLALGCAGAIFGGIYTCNSDGPLVPCPECTNQTGNMCAGAPCNNSVDIEHKIKTVIPTPVGKEGNIGVDYHSGGTCDRTFRTCIDGVCVVSAGGPGSCPDAVPAGNKCPGTGA